jgi:hypothetical protein
MTELKPIRVPIAAPLTNREAAEAGNYTTDSLLLNCYIETSPDGKVFVVKRPGFSSAYTYNSGGATNGQGTVYHQGGLYAMGSNVLYRLTGAANGSADGTAWTSNTVTWTKRFNTGCTVFNGQIFIFGGGGSGGFSYFNDVWASSDGVNWTQVVSAAPWTARNGAEVVVLGNTLYLMGGANASGAFNDVWSTTDGVNWTEVVGAAPWTARNGHRVVALNQGMFLMGGSDSSGTLLNDVWFSPDGATWTQQVVNAGWSARTDFCALAYANKLWVFGGFNAGALQTVYSSPDGINWTNTGNLPAVRYGLAGVVYKNRMFLTCGFDNATRTTTVWSTTDGASFTTVTAAYGGSAVYDHRMVVFKAASSAINAPTMWIVAGDAGTLLNSTQPATLNVALPSSFSITTAGATNAQWQFTTQNAGQYLVFKNTSDAWVLEAGTVQKITSTNYPAATVPGIVNLDDTVYVMDAAGVIYGSPLSTPFGWSSLNFITADYESDVGVMLIKYQNYALALKSTTLQFFYNAGRYPGSPLLPVKNANSRVGCSSAALVVQMDNTIIFVARTEQRGNYVAMLNGFQPVRVSDPAVERILDSWRPAAATDKAFPIRHNGHDFYVMTLTNTADGVTVAYDLTEKRWHIWQSGSTPAAFRAANYVTDGQYDYLQDNTLGILYQVNAGIYQDNGTAITVRGTGVKVDGGTNERKFCSSLTVIGDRQAATTPNTATISWSDDDGVTFSTGRTVDLSAARPRLTRCGSFRRRTHRIEHSSNNPMRVEAFELGLR